MIHGNMILLDKLKTSASIPRASRWHSYPYESMLPCLQSAALLLATVIAAQPAQDVAAPSGPTLTNTATFEAVWTTVRDSHWDRTLGGVDWDAVRVELLPKAAAAPSNDALREVLMDALSKLKQSHFSIIPGELARTDEGANEDASQPGSTVASQPSDASHEGQSGAKFVFMPHAGTPNTWDAIVVAVTPGSPADRAGITPGMRVVKISGESAESSRTLGERLPIGDGLERYERAHIADAATTGDPGTTRSWQIETIDGTTLTADVTYEADARPHTKFGSLPSMPTELTWRHLDETERERWGATHHEIGLIQFNIWLIPVARPFDLAMDTLRSADGIIIDLRGNPGGIGAMAMGIAGHFTSEPSELGEMTTRDASLRFKTNPRTVSTTGVAVTPYAGPVAILVDESTASTSEIFAGGMQFLKRAKIFGTRTAGAALPAVTMPLPNGDVFLHAIADYRLPNGTALEATGVIPDNARPYTRTDYAQLGDPAMAEAVRWIAAQPTHSP